MTQEMLGKTILVTGSGKGLGSAIAIEAGRRGANVVVHYRSSQASAEDVFKKVQETGCNCILVKADIESAAGVEHLCSEAEKAFGHIDILVNNAALQFNISFDKYTPDKVRKIFDVNLGGYLRMIQRLLPNLRKNGWGRIVNISSIHAKRPTQFDPCYGMTKGAIKMMTREVALEVAADENITANVVELGYVEIGTKSGNPPSAVDMSFMDYPKMFDMKEILPNRLITPEDVAPTVLFLASDMAKMINGSSIRVDDTGILL